MQGTRLAVHIVPPGSSGTHFKPTVLSVRPKRELRWLGHLLVPGIFDGEHYFLLEPIGENRTRRTQGEKFFGLLVDLLGSTLAAAVTGFKAMNTALKQQAERDEIMPRSPNDVRFVPIADMAPLIRSPRRRVAAIANGTVDAERLGGLHVDDQLVFGRRLHGKLAGLGTL